MNIRVQYTKGNKYTKKWVGTASVISNDGTSMGVFALESLYNGGRFVSERGILDHIASLSDGYEVVSVSKVDEISQ